MTSKIHPSWKEALSGEFEKAYFTKLESFILNEYATQTCYPPESQIFAAFERPFTQVKVVIIGQDPYHQQNQANGLCFSVNDGVNVPPSLRNIFEEIYRDLAIEKPLSGNLTRWAEQGVLLLNATLTVRQNAAGSHQKLGWEKFTDAVIEVISDKRENIVFLLWGNYAKKKGAKIDKNKHLVLESGHPSPLSANQGHWFDRKHFSTTNKYLLSNNIEPIKW